MPIEKGLQSAVIIFDGMDRDQQDRVRIIVQEYIDDGYDAFRAIIKAVNEVLDRDK